jgi:hypothetical protein
MGSVGRAVTIESGRYDHSELTRPCARTSARRRQPESRETDKAENRNSDGYRQCYPERPHVTSLRLQPADDVDLYAGVLRLGFGNTADRRHSDFEPVRRGPSQLDLVSPDIPYENFILFGWRLAFFDNDHGPPISGRNNPHMKSTARAVIVPPGDTASSNTPMVHHRLVHGPLGSKT